MNKNYQKRYTFSPSLASNWTSNSISCDYCLQLGITLDFSGTPDGEFFVDVSNDNENWMATTFTEGQILAEGSSDNHCLTLKDFSFGWIRLRYVRSSGTGSLSAIIQVKAT